MRRRLMQLLRRTKARAVRALPRTRARAIATFEEVTGAAVQPVPQVGAVDPSEARMSVDPSSSASAFALTLPPKFQGWQAAVATVPDARIVGPGRGVVDADGRLVLASLWDEEHYRREFRRRVPADRARFAGTATSLLTLWDDNYYHWLIDALPRLGVLEASGRSIADLPVIVPARLSSFQEDSLDLLGIGPAQRIPYDGSSLRVRELVWPSPAAPIGFCREFTRTWLRNTFVRPESRPARRLYVARHTRRVANEAEIWPLLESRGFEKIYAESLSFAQQVDLFASAELVVGPHGAGMANVVFADRAAVLEIFQPGYINTGPYAVSRASGHAYWALVGERSGDAGVAKNFDIAVDPRRLTHLLDQMLVTV